MSLRIEAFAKALGEGDYTLLACGLKLIIYTFPETFSVFLQLL